ncbi:TonB-dependent receptor domain-containing protein [Novosphingobium sp. 9]|uniref:TonB-dependent receptor domain-containing protein n=1 Tax=Novosphingobium sp. 9 TaxID=2025349 RepID=UPI0021B554BB|nr:TonB-dependent receptor [Novosphingobium sp. 9]
MTSKMKCLLLASACIAGLPAVAQAQTEAAASTPDTGASNDTASDANAIVVTGSRLSNPNLEQAAPIMTMSSKTIALTGQQNVENILAQMPQIVPGEGASSNNPGDGVATADLRGLGAQRTLVLVNGHRYVSYDTNQIVDLNTIPAPLLERVDVVTGGKSAVYGSDAVSGVINFVTKQDYQGVEAGGNYRLTTYGDGGQYDGYLMVGKNFADGRGNITLYGDYMHRNGILQSARSYTANAQTDDGAGGLMNGGSSITPQGSAVLNGTTNIFGTDGSISPYSSSDAYNYASENYLQIPQTRKMLFAQWHYDVSDHLKLYGEAQYVDNKVTTQLAATPVDDDFEITDNSPYLSSAAQSWLASGDTDGDGLTTVELKRRMNEIGDRIQVQDSKAYRALLGAKGNITGNWNYDVYGSYARTHLVQKQYGNVSYSKLQQALLTTTDADGNLVCTDQSNGCVPINVFGEGNISQAAADFISVDTVNRSTIVEKVANASITNNNLFDLGAGPAGLAFGAEYRSEHGNYDPDEELASGDVIGFNANEPISGGYNVKELFAEMDVPLLADMPFVHNLAFNGAARYSDYSTSVGSVGTYSVGLVYAPIKDISFRGQFSRAVRAPTVNDLYSSAAQNYEEAVDPCSEAVALTNSNLNSSCLASGVPASAIGSGYQTDSQIESYNGGSTSLKAESAYTYTLGVALQPSFLPRFSMTVDYYHIKISNYITTLGTQTLINQCYGTSENGYTPTNTDACSLLPRNSNSYNIDGAIDDLTNAGMVKTSGIDFEAKYSIPLNFGTDHSSNLDIDFAGTRLISWTLSPDGESDDAYSCAGKFGVTCGNVYAKWRWNTRATWSTEGLTLSLNWRHLSPVDGDATGYSVEHIKAYDYFDGTAQIDVNHMFTWTIGMNNMFNKKPPILGDNQEQSNTYPSTYDVMGRTFFTGIKVDFQ